MSASKTKKLEHHFGSESDQVRKAMQKYQERTQELLDIYNNDEACRAFLFDMKWPNGFLCICGHTEYFSPGSRHLYECKKCRRQHSLTTKTIFEKTRIELWKWFQMLILIQRNRPKPSTREFAEKLDLRPEQAKIMKGKIESHIHQILDKFSDKVDRNLKSKRLGSKYGKKIKKIDF